jgi:hypothetical protein
LDEGSAATPTVLVNVARYLAIERLQWRYGARTGPISGVCTGSAMRKKTTMRVEIVSPDLK